MDFWALYIWGGVCLFWKIVDDLNDQQEAERQDHPPGTEYINESGWGTYVGIGVLCLFLWWAYPIPAIARWAWSKRENG